MSLLRLMNYPPFGPFGFAQGPISGVTLACTLTARKTIRCCRLKPPAVRLRRTAGNEFAKAFSSVSPGKQFLTGAYGFTR
jgi:hypothetical protein